MLDPGAALDSMMIRDEAKEAGAATRVLFLLPSLGTAIFVILSLRPVGILGRAASDLLAVVILPSILAWGLPKVLLLADQVGTSNYRRWRTYCCHALVPALTMAFLARLVFHFSGILAGLCLGLGLCLSSRAFVAAHDEWLDLPEDGRWVAGGIFLSCLLACGLATAFLLDAGILARSA
ncbi:MAG: hypothetical protein CMH55_00930 [Myxococcales bacterium]|nr:hypothetical protein [Myxococcales bacterium]|tara:strand:- start:410 stop:946 length:537 start_codon:yes stop_codon:yes gene_type:complete